VIRKWKDEKEKAAQLAALRVKKAGAGQPAAEPQFPPASGLEGG